MCVLGQRHAKSIALEMRVTVNFRRETLRFREWRNTHIFVYNLLGESEKSSPLSIIGLNFVER